MGSSAPRGSSSQRAAFPVASDIAYVRAARAAADGDAPAACVALVESGVPDGVRHSLMSARRWALSEDEAAEITADAVAELFERMSTHPGPVTNIGGLLWRIASRRAVDRLRVSTRLLPIDERLAGNGDEPEDPLERLGHEVIRQARLRGAIALARRLLPRLGHLTAQRVLGYLLDAIERGEDRVDDAEIAAALGYTKDQVRKAKARGLERLGQIAQQMHDKVEVMEEEERPQSVAGS